MRNDVEIKIRALLEGTESVDALARDLEGLFRQSNKDLKDPSRRMSRGLRRTENQVARLRKGIRGLASSFGPLATAAGAGLVSTKGLNDARELELSLSRIQGLVGAAPEQIEVYRQSLDGIGRESAKDNRELADALFFVTSAGFEGSEALDVLRASARASSAGLGDTKTVADAVTSAVNAYGLENLSAAEATDILTSTVREGKAEAESIASSLGKVVPVAAEVGVGFNEVGATIAALTRVGNTADEATTQLTSTLTSIIKPTGAAESELKKFGLSSEELRKTIREDGLLTALQQIKDSIGDNDTALAKIFPNVRALRGVLALLGENADDVRKIFDSLEDSTGATDKAFDAFANTADFKLKQSLVELDGVLTRLGASTLPTVVNLLEKVAKFTGGLEILITGESFDPSVNLDLKFEELQEQLEQLEGIREGIEEGNRGIVNGELIVDEESLNAAVERVTTELEEIRRKSEEINNLGPVVLPTNRNEEPDSPATDSEDEEDEIIEKPASFRDSGKSGEQIRVDQITAVIKKLKEQQETFGFTAQETAVYRLEQLGASESQVELARSITTTIESIQEEAQALEVERRLYSERTQEIIASAHADAELKEELEDQIRLLGLSARERAQDAAAAELSAEASDAQRLAVRELAGELFDLQDAANRAFGTMQQLAINAARGMQSALSDFFFDPFEDGLEGLLSTFVETIRRMVSELLAQQALLAILRVIPGGDAISAGLGFASANVNHAGGMAGTGPVRKVPTAVFLNAPRFHDGGVPGLAADEVPAILQTGEEVLTRDDPRNVMNGGGQGGEVSIKNITLFDRSVLDDYIMSSGPLERVILNTVGGN